MSLTNVADATLYSLDITNPGADGIDLQLGGGASAPTFDIESNEISGQSGAGIAAGIGIDGQSQNRSTLALGLQTNDVTMAGTQSHDGIDVSETGTGSGSVCLSAARNTVASSASGAHDLALAQQTPAGTFGIQNYDGSSDVPTFLFAANPLAHGAGGASATTVGNAFTSGSCEVGGTVTS